MKYFSSNWEIIFVWKSFGFSAFLERADVAQNDRIQSDIIESAKWKYKMMEYKVIEYKMIVQSKVQKIMANSESWQ